MRVRPVLTYHSDHDSASSAPARLKTTPARWANRPQPFRLLVAACVMLHVEEQRHPDTFSTLSINGLRRPGRIEALFRRVCCQQKLTGGSNHRADPVRQCRNITQMHANGPPMNANILVLIAPSQRIVGDSAMPVAARDSPPRQASRRHPGSSSAVRPIARKRNRRARKTRRWQQSLKGPGRCV